MINRPIPFSQRKTDWLLVGFFVLNLTFITYIVDIEQLILPNPYTYQQPPWPPAPHSATPRSRRTRPP